MSIKFFCNQSPLDDGSGYENYDLEEDEGDYSGYDVNDDDEDDDYGTVKSDPATDLVSPILYIFVEKGICGIDTYVYQHPHTPPDS